MKGEFLYKMQHLPNYELKSRLIGSDMLNYYIQVQRSYYFHYVKLENAKLEGEILTRPWYIIPLRTAEKIEEDYSTNYPLEWRECGRIYNAFRLRYSRLHKKIEEMLFSGTCIFLTLTFTDEVLANTNEQTRRKYVSRCLKKYNTKYIANIDYGEKNEREHYHAIILTENFNHKDWQYGIVNFERVKQTSDCKALANYINKLTNHAVKKTTKRNHMIYSR